MNRENSPGAIEQAENEAWDRAMDDSGYSIVQRPCPECGHREPVFVIEHRDLVKNEAVSVTCPECGEGYANPIIGPKERREYKKYAE